MLGKIGGNAGRRRRPRRQCLRVLPFCFVNSFFDVPDGEHVFVELPAIGSAQRALQTLGIVQDHVEDALLIFFQSRAARRVLLDLTGSEEPLENRARSDFRRHGRSRRPPGDAVAVRATVSVIAIAALNTFLTAQFQRCKSRLSLEALGRDLVHRYADLDVFPECLSWMDAGEIRSAGASVVPLAVSQSPAGVMG